MGRAWYCVHTHHGHSTNVKKILESRGIQCFQPMEMVEYKQQKYKMKPLLGDYLLVCFDIAKDNWRLIYQTRNVKGLLGLTKQAPSRVPQRSIRLLQALSANTDTILPENLVRVLRGKHAGKLGIAEHSDGQQVALRLLDGKNTASLFNRQNVVLTKWTKAT